MNANKFVLKAFDYDINKIVATMNLEEGGKVQKYIDTQVLKLSAPFIPKDTNALIESGNINTKIGSGEIRYRTPYARRWYYMPARFQEAPQRGNYWFERMKQQYKEQILHGAQRQARK